MTLQVGQGRRQRAGAGGGLRLRGGGVRVGGGGGGGAAGGGAAVAGAGGVGGDAAAADQRAPGPRSGALAPGELYPPLLTSVIKMNEALHCLINPQQTILWFDISIIID